MQVAIYARLSITREQSVSIERQLESARAYAKARNWEIVLEATDDGVSASQNKPEHRLGWKTIINSPKHYKAVIVWKTDRLARNVLDFLNADAALQKRNAGIVSVEEPIDMTTAQGRGFATMLQVFAEMEASAISDRVSAAHLALKKQGRIPSGRPAYGYKAIDNPNGAGKVVAKDPDTLPYVTEAVNRAMQGDSLYSISVFMNNAGAPKRANKARKHNQWTPNGVHGFLKSPTLAGMTAYTPGRHKSEFGLSDVLRDEQGLPIVNEDIAIMSVEQWYSMQELIKARRKPGYSTRTNNPSLLYGIAKCMYCQGNMTKSGGQHLVCGNRVCETRPSIKQSALEDFVTNIVLESMGHLRIIKRVVDADADAMKLADIERAMKDATERMVLDDDMQPWIERIEALKQAKKSLETAEATFKDEDTGQTIADVLNGDDTQAKRDALKAVIVNINIETGKRGYRAVQTERIKIRWKATPMQMKGRKRVWLETGWAFTDAPEDMGKLVDTTWEGTEAP